MVTKAMGGALPEQADPTLFRRVLDIGCGTGGWLIEVEEIKLLFRTLEPFIRKWGPHPKQL